MKNPTVGARSSLTSDGLPCPGTCVELASELEDVRAELAEARHVAERWGSQELSEWVSTNVDHSFGVPHEEILKALKGFKAERDEAYADARRYQERLNRVVEAKQAELDEMRDCRGYHAERAKYYKECADRLNWDSHALRLAKRADDLEAENERLRADVAELSADVYKCAEERDACEEMRRASMERCARRSEKALADIDADRNRAVSAYLATVKERDQARKEAQVWERAAHAAQQRHDDGLIAFNDELEQRIRVMQEVAATLLGEASECAEAG
jgi:hypothetical protein